MSEIKKVKGRILHIQHFSVDDGPGIRSTVFLKGCPLRCAWCHNPESLSFQKDLLYRPDRCMHCGACAQVCPNGCHKMEAEEHHFDRALCQGCNRCSLVCAFGALQTAGQDTTVEEVMEELLLEKVFYLQSGGGVTLSGGEPLAQPDFSLALLEACREEGIHTAVETCGFASKETLAKMAEATDLFLFDYKLTDSALHKRYTGVSNRVILENLALLHSLGSKTVLRCPMIPGVNLNEAHYQGIISLARTYDSIAEIQLEPYHPLGIGKAESLGKHSDYQGKDFLEKSDLQTALELIQSHVSIPVKIN